MRLLLLKSSLTIIQDIKRSLDNQASTSQNPESKSSTTMSGVGPAVSKPTPHVFKLMSNSTHSALPQNLQLQNLKNLLDDKDLIEVRILLIATTNTQTHVSRIPYI